MEENLKRALKKAKYEPLAELKDKIWRKIVTRDKRIAYLKLISFSSVGIVSLMGFIPMWKMLANDFTQSGFYEYLSLALSKGGIFSSFWKEFIFTLAESLPTMSIVFSLTLVFIFLLSLRYVVKQIINNRHIGPSYAAI
jgi:hypothetical protein